MTSSKQNLLEATAMYRLICNTTGRTVGIEYLWESGEIGILWREEVDLEAKRVPIDSLPD